MFFPAFPVTENRYLLLFINGSTLALTDQSSPVMPPVKVRSSLSGSRVLSTISPRYFALIPALTVSPATGMLISAENRVLVLDFQVMADVLITRVHPKNWNVRDWSPRLMSTRILSAVSDIRASNPSDIILESSPTGSMKMLYRSIRCS